MQRLPTRLQELVKYYPYNKGSLVTEDELLSRPRFSTRQYDALFVRVETLLTQGAVQPKQHPIQLLLDAFQLPIENPSGGEHIALWHTVKNAASEEATSSDPEGPQFTRIFVDETIQLLSLIPADNNAPTSPTLFTSPITKVVSRKRSSSLTKVLENTTPRSNANNGSTPVSPTSPSSIVITDWTQFSLAGFGDTPTTQPLVALLDQDDDIEVTQPRFSRKTSRQRGKSHTRRRRSEDHEPPETLPSSHSKSESSIVETKLASVHVIQIDEAFIDFWSDAIVDPISVNWPTFLVCGLKQIPGAQSPIRWLVIEQAYSHQQPSRVPSPDGRHRGRSPRPSFRSDISGIRINSMFSSARKRFSVFSKSATDLDLKKSGCKTPIVGELGEVLVEEEPTFPSAPPTKVDHHFDRDAVVGAPVTGGATANVADQPKADDTSTVSVVGAPTAEPGPMPKVRTCRIGIASLIIDFSMEEFDRVPASTEAPSIEPTPQSGDSYNGLPRSSLRTSEEAVSVEQGSPQSLDGINPKINTADPVAKVIPLAADTFDSRSTQRTGDPMALASGPAPTTENPVIKEARIHAEQVQQGVTVHEVEDRLGEPSNVAQVDVADGSREVADAVAMPSALETVAVVLATSIVNDEAPEHIAEEPHVAEHSSRTAPTEFVAASTVESVMDDLPAVSIPDVQGKVTAIEMGAQLEPDSIACAVDAAEEGVEVAELVEIPTPAPEEFVALVEETPGSDTGAEIAGVETEHAADQVPELAIEEVQPLVQDTLAQAAAEAPLVVASPVPEVEAFVSAAQDIPLAEVEAQVALEGFISEARVVETQDTGVSTPVPENAALVDETPGPLEVHADVSGPIEAAPAVALESEAVEDKAPEPLVKAIAEANARATSSNPLELSIEAELPTQFVDTEPAETLLSQSIAEAATAALATADETIMEAQPTSDAPPTPESAPIKDASEPAQLAPVTAADLEPVIEEAQVLVKDAAPSASKPVAVTPTVIIEEPVAHDVQVSIEIEEPSSESAPQSVYEIAIPVPEEISSVDVDGTHEVAEDAEPAPHAHEIDVPIEEIQDVVDADEPGTRTAEAEPVEVGEPVPVVEEAHGPVEAEDPSLVAVEVTEEVVASQQGELG